MEKTIPNSPAKRHIPFFRKGVLTFEESKHTLTWNKGYVCSKKQRGECGLDEKRVKVENLERNFSRLAKSFEIPDANKLRSLQKVIGEILHDQIDEMLESDDFVHGIFDNAIVLMAEDIEKKDDKMFKRDLNDAVDAMKKEEATKAEFVCGLLLGCIFVFAKKNVSEVEAGRVLAYLSQKVYLSNEGKIVKIKLNDFGELVFQFLKKYNPAYTEPFTWFVEIQKFEMPRYREIAKNIRTGKLDLAIPSLAIGAAMAKTMTVLPNLGKMDNKSVLSLLWVLQESPMGQVAQDLNRLIKGRKKEKDT